MVRTRNSKPNSKTALSLIDEERTQFSDEDFNIDPDLLSAEYNQVRRPVLPYAIVVNDNPAGILIPVEQLEKANWRVMPEEDELTTVSLTEDVTGLLITSARLLVLGFVPEYIRYKADEPELGGSIVGLYDEYRNSFDKKTMDAVSEHALVFLDDNNRPLHTEAIVVRFKNVALWSFKAVREEYYRLLEKAFSDYCKVPFSGKTDKWRSLGIIDCQFKAVKEGEGNNKHWCCKTVKYTKPTTENLPSLYLGRPEQKTSVWQLHDGIAGFTETPLLAATEEVEVQALPPTQTAQQRKEESRTSKTPKTAGRPLKKVTQVSEPEDDFEDELDAEEDEADDFEDFDEFDEDEPNF